MRKLPKNSLSLVPMIPTAQRPKDVGWAARVESTAAGLSRLGSADRLDR
jgi:hypothetical protein